MKSIKPNKNHNLSVVNMASYNVPEFKEYVGKQWVNYGRRNLFPVELIDLFNSSALHNAIVTGKVNYIVGKGLQYSDQIKEFVMNPNSYETMQDIFNKVCMDYELFNGFAIEVIRNRKGEIAEIYHGDYSNYRISSNGNSLIYSEDWLSKYSTNANRKQNHNPEYLDVPKFKPNGKEKKSVIYYTEYRPGMIYYPLPDYVGALAQIETSVEIGNYDLNEIQNGFSGGTMINFFNGEVTEEEQEKIEEKVTEKFAGSQNANRFLMNFAEDKEHGATVESLSGNDLADRYEKLEQRVNDTIYKGHKVPPVLFWDSTEGALGQRNEMIDAYELFKETYVTRRQSRLIEVFNDILEYKGLPRDLTVQELYPLTRELEIGADTIERLVGDEALAKYISAKYGVESKPNQNVNDQINLAVEEAGVIQHFFQTAKHMEGEPLFMTEVNSHEDLFSLSMAEGDEIKAKIGGIVRSNPEISMTEVANVLKMDLAIIEVYVAQMIADGLLIRSGVSLSVTPQILPLMIKQPQSDFIVAYQYAERPDALPAKKTRPFCQRLVAMSKMGKVWLKEDIEGMRNNMQVSFIDDIRDVWLYRGGWYRRPGMEVSVPFCRHVWKQVILDKKQLIERR